MEGVRRHGGHRLCPGAWLRDGGGADRRPAHRLHAVVARYADDHDHLDPIDDLDLDEPHHQLDDEHHGCIEHDDIHHHTEHDDVDEHREIRDDHDHDHDGGSLTGLPDGESASTSAVRVV